MAISDLKVSKSKNDVLVTHSLGSCLGLTVYDPAAGVGGLIHCLLPRGKKGDPKVMAKQSMYVNTGVALLMRTIFALKARRENLILKAAGCAEMQGVGGSNMFSVGARNYAALIKLLDLNKMKLAAEDVGGSIPRTMRMDIRTGTVEIASCGKRWTI